MRPALLRLLKRPSAVSILDSLISSPIEIEHLGSRPTCLRCYAQWTQKFSPPRRQAPEKHPFSLPVYDIGTSNDLTHSQKDSASDTNVEFPSASLSLQPDRLEFESDIGHTRDIGTRLVDDPRHRHDFSLWEELLRYRQRHYGDKGTLDIFRGLMRRVDGVYLPVHGESADFLWRSFVNLGLENQSILEELADYAVKVYEEEGTYWGRFYESVVGGFFERDMVQHAVRWHWKLEAPHLTRPNVVLRVLEPALSVRTGRCFVLRNGRFRRISPGVRAFKNICPTNDGHDLYRPVISTLLQRGHTEDALLMHGLLVERHHHPPSYDDIYPLLDYAKLHELWDDYLHLKEYAEGRFSVPSESADQTVAVLDEQRPNTNAINPQTGKRMKKKPLKDEFGARFFATAAFGFDTVLAALAMFRIPVIGPLSLREMAIRSYGSRDIHEKLQRLQKAGISIGDSVYARLLRKLAMENRDILLADLLESDQHPDMLEDAGMQESLLVSNYMARDGRQYNLTLAILGELLKDNFELTNIHFRKYIAAGELVLAAKVVDEMALVGQTLTPLSLDYMVKQVLGPRRPGKNPTANPPGTQIDPVAFVIRTLRRLVPAGQFVNPRIWIELLKRLGMTKRFDELRNFCLWIASHYSSLRKQAAVSDTVTPFPGKSKPQSWSTALSPDGADRMLQKIFNVQMQKAIVAWGFKMPIPRDHEVKAYNTSNEEGEQPIPWTRGLVLLRELEGEGVQLSEFWIHRMCRYRLAVLFGRPRVSARPANRVLRQKNPYSLQQVLTDIDRAWGAPLFQGQEYTDLYQLVNPPLLTVKARLRKQRQLRRQTEAKKGLAVNSKNR